MAAVHHLGFVGRRLGPPTTTSWWSLSHTHTHLTALLYRLYRCAKFGWNRCSISITWNFQYFAVWLENADLCPQNWGDRGISPPKWGAMSTKPPKGTSLLIPVVWAIKRENPSMGLTCRWVHEKGINKKKFVTFHPFAQKPPIEGFAPNLSQP